MCTITSSSGRDCVLIILFQLYGTKSAFTCNQDEISSGDKKFQFKFEFHPGMKRVEFHPGMKFNLKENLPLNIKSYKLYHFSLIC